MRGTGEKMLKSLSLNHIFVSKIKVSWINSDVSFIIKIPESILIMKVCHMPNIFGFY